MLFRSLWHCVLLVCVRVCLCVYVCVCPSSFAELQGEGLVASVGTLPPAETTGKEDNMDAVWLPLLQMLLLSLFFAVVVIVVCVFSIYVCECVRV